MTASSSTHNISDPSVWVTRFTPVIGPGEVLDLACGSGRHAKWLAGRGCPVLAVDRDEQSLALAAGPGITTMQLDLESGEDSAWPFEARRFAAIVVTNYLHRPLFPHLLDSLAEGGVLIYETFAAGNGQFGKPSNPHFLLQPGELLQLCAGLRVVAFEDGYVNLPKPALIQRICAAKSGIAVDPDSPDRWRLD